MIGLLTQLRMRAYALWRQRWIALATAWGLMLLGSTVVMLLPDQYEASSRVYADTDSLMGPLLKGIAVQDDLTQQLAVMQSTLLGRPNLLKVARSVDLDLGAKNDIQVEGILNSLASRTTVEVTGSKLFRIAHIDSDPRRAKAVVQAFLGIFVDNNLGQDRDDMENAQSFIAKQIAGYEAQLRDTEKRIADFRGQHSDIISDGSSFSARLQKARADVDDATAALREARDKKTSLMSQVQTAPQSLPDSSPEEEAKDPSLAKLRELKGELNKKLAIYSNQHPDVIALKKQLASLEMQSADSAIALGERELTAANDALKRLQEMATSAPLLEAQMADMNRDYAVLKQKYDELRVRGESARISRDVKMDTGAMQFRVIEPPEVPPIPSGPKRRLLLLAVLCASIGGGLAIAFLLSEMDDSFATPRHLKEAFNLPLLGSVCFIPTETDKTKRYQDAMAVSLGSGAMLMLCGFLIALTSVDLTSLRHLASGLFGVGV